MIEAIILGVAGGLLAIISYFLNRLVKQFDNLSAQFTILNRTMLRIDKDLSGDIGIIKIQLGMVQKALCEIDPVWDRLRAVEQELIAVKHDRRGHWHKENE